MFEVNGYEIRLRDVLDEKWAAYFAPFELSVEAEGSLLTGMAHDQAELFGVLLKVRDLGLRLVSVNPTPPLKITVHTWEQVNLHDLAALTFAARPAQVQQERLTVEDIAARFHSFLAENPARILCAMSGETLVGLLVLYVQNPRVLESNPGALLDGHPVIAPGSNPQLVSVALLEAAVALAHAEGFSRIEFATRMENGKRPYQAWYEACGFREAGCYVEMTRPVEAQIPQGGPPPEGFTIQPLAAASKEALYRCYHAAFSRGDAQFFFNQDETERRVYFESLGYEDALPEPASFVLLKDQQLVGFSFVLPFGEGNCHISCMCIAAEYRGRGLGKYLLDNIVAQAARRGYRTITLGTDIHMGAYQLYCKNGFTVVEGNVLWGWRA